MYIYLGASMPRKKIFSFVNGPKLLLFLVIKSNLCEILLNYFTV